ncbi:hypothetical protein DRQ07_00505 [candidate division KSB1 bacterium]|nr:MAG: hypothetical protein DRQ07_00505 [candidate division KSB1 bacterium]
MTENQTDWINMNDEKREIAVGFTVILSLIILVGGILWGKKGSVFSKKEIYRVSFSSASGLKPGDNVIVRGLHKGNVKDIKLTDNGVLVEFLVDKNIKLYSDMTITINGLELMGSRVLVLNPGKSGEPASSQKIYTGINTPGIDEIFSGLTRTMNSVDSILAYLNGFADSGQISATIKNINSVVEELKMFAVENRVGIKSAVDRVDRIARAAEQDSVVQKFTSALKRADSTLFLIQKSAHRLAEGEGSAGKLMKDSTLYFQLLSSSKKLDSLITDIKKNPSKYIHISVF